MAFRRGFIFISCLRFFLSIFLIPMALVPVDTLTFPLNSLKLERALLQRTLIARFALKVIFQLLCSGEIPK